MEVLHKTSNVTTVTEVRNASARLLPVCGAPWCMLLQHSIMLRSVFIVECGNARCLCAMRVFEVQASSSSPRLPLCQI